MWAPEDRGPEESALLRCKNVEEKTGFNTSVGLVVKLLWNYHLEGLFTAQRITWQSHLQRLMEEKMDIWGKHMWGESAVLGKGDRRKEFLVVTTGLWQSPLSHALLSPWDQAWRWRSQLGLGWTLKYRQHLSQLQTTKDKTREGSGGVGQAA